MQESRRTSVRIGAALIGAAVLLAGCADQDGTGTPDLVAPTAAPDPGGAPEIRTLVGQPTGPDPTVGAVTTLAKVDGWRALDLDAHSTFAVLELAYDEETARTLWDENVAADLPVRTGDPREPGVYGDLADVDLDTHVVALFSSGESGSCPEWVQGMTTDDSGTVDIRTARDAGACTDDYNPYGVVLVVDRDAVPEPAELSAAHGVVDGTEVLGVLVGEYPLAP